MRATTLLILLCGACLARAAEETPYQKETRERQARIEAKAPTISAEETFHRYLADMNSGHWVKASSYLHDDALRALKAKSLNALRDASYARRAQFCKRAGIHSIPDLQHAPPHVFFDAVMRDADLVKQYLAHLRNDALESVTASEDKTDAEIRVKFKGKDPETISALLVTGNTTRDWKMVLIPPLDNAR